MSDLTSDARRDEHRRDQRRTLRIAIGVVVVGLIVGTALGARLRLYDAFFVGAFVSLLAYYSDWADKRTGRRIAILSVGGVCMVAALVTDFL